MAVRASKINNLYGSSLNRSAPKKKDDDTTIQFVTAELSHISFNCPQWDKNFFIHDILLPDDFSEIERSFSSSESSTPVDQVHTMSPRTRSKIKDKLLSFYAARRGFRKHTFVTLSFINKIDDVTAVSLLNSFLSQLRKRFPNLNYLWIAERQDGKRNGYEHCTGNVHFHIFFDIYLPVVTYNALWILQQYNAGIEHPSLSSDKVISLYRTDQKELQRHLNPFDVKQVTTITGISFYLSKYVTKNETSLHCRLWHCSRSVSRLFTGYAIPRGVFAAASDSKINFVVNTKTGELFTPRALISDYAVLYRIYNVKYFSSFLREMDAMNARVLRGMIPPPALIEQSFDMAHHLANTPHLNHISI